MNKVLAVNIDPTIFSPAGNFPTIGSFINTLIPNIFVISGVIFFIIFIYAGFAMIAAGQAEPEKWKKIQAVMSSALVGLIIIFVAYWIIKIIEIVTGLNIFNPSQTL